MRRSQLKFLQDACIVALPSDTLLSDAGLFPAPVGDLGELGLETAQPGPEGRVEAAIVAVDAVRLLDAAGQGGEITARGVAFLAQGRELGFHQRRLRRLGFGEQSGIGQYTLRMRLPLASRSETRPELSTLNGPIFPRTMPCRLTV